MTQVYAHRGLHRHERENTTAAFLAAVALGVDGVELDVRQTLEGALVVHHDPAIGGRRLIATPRDDLPSYVPTLVEALAACRGVAVNVEVKNSPEDGDAYDVSGRLVHDVVEAVRDADALATVLFSSFDRSTCRQLRALDDSLRVGWLLERRDDVTESLQWATVNGLDAVHPPVSRVTSAGAALARELGLQLNVWTVNSARNLRAMVEAGVDCVITDEPARALELARGTPA